MKFKNIRLNAIAFLALMVGSTGLTTQAVDLSMLAGNVATGVFFGALPVTVAFAERDLAESPEYDDHFPDPALGCAVASILTVLAPLLAAKQELSPGQVTFNKTIFISSLVSLVIATWANDKYRKSVNEYVSKRFDDLILKINKRFGTSLK